MRANRLVLAGSFCWNKDCPDYGLADHGNIVKYGRTGKGTQRLKCTTCERVFVVQLTDVNCCLDRVEA
jgi:transposase-like protein